MISTTRSRLTAQRTPHLFATILLEPLGIQLPLFRLFPKASYAHHGHHVHIVGHSCPSFPGDEEAFGLRVNTRNLVTLPRLIGE